MRTIYGTVNSTGAFKRTGYSLQGAKVSAVRAGLHVIATSSALGYNIEIVCVKRGNVWVHTGLSAA